LVDFEGGGIVPYAAATGACLSHVCDIGMGVERYDVHCRFVLPYACFDIANLTPISQCSIAINPLCRVQQCMTFLPVRCMIDVLKWHSCSACCMYCLSVSVVELALGRPCFVHGCIGFRCEESDCMPFGG
jgi:hypothetical protein